MAGTDDERPEPPAAPEIGDLVIVPYPAVRERYGCPAEAGLLLEDRRRSVKVFFPGPDQTLWLDRSRIQRVTGGDLPVDPLLACLHRVARLVGAEELEMHERTPERGEFRFHTAGADIDLLETVREIAGPALRTLRIEPGGMRFVRLSLVLDLPLADQASGSSIRCSAPLDASKRKGTAGRCP